MGTNLITVFILSGILGAIIVVTGCIKVLSKNGEINLKTAGFILSGFIFIALPVISTISLEWGEIKILVNTTNDKAIALQKTLDSLKVSNKNLQDELSALQEKVRDFGIIMSNPHLSAQGKALATREINTSFEDIAHRIENINASLDSATSKNTQVINGVKRYEHQRWNRVKQK